MNRGVLVGSLLGLLVATGCAGAMRGPRSTAVDVDAAAGWTALAEGKSEVAATAFVRALARDPADARALFGAGNLAREQGDPETAMARSLALLESASGGKNDLAVALAGAVLSRVPRLLSELPDRRAAESRLLLLEPRHFSWRARYALALARLEIARKRADAKLMAEVSAKAGCVPAMAYVGEGGRLPLLDLRAETFVEAKRPSRLVASGCQFQLHTDDGRMGIKVLRAEVELRSGPHAIVLDYGGPARLRVDSGPWHTHAGSLETHGPRWSAAQVEVAAGKHQVEIRLGMVGGSTELSLLAMPAATATTMPPAIGDGDAAMIELASTLEANLAGDSDRVLEGIERLSARSRYALGLAAAGRLGMMDTTRPIDVTRDKARVLWQQALTADPKLARVWLDMSDLEMQRERPREAAVHAERATELASRWWPAQLALAGALRAQGLERPADEALAAGLAPVERGLGGCAMIDTVFQRKQDLSEMAAAGRLIEALGRCDAQSPQLRTWAQDHGDAKGAIALVRKALPTSPEPLWLRMELADALFAQGDTATAAKELAALAGDAPRDTRAWIRLADAQGSRAATRAMLARTLARFPGRADVRRAARLVGLPLPLDEYRIDGAKVVAEYLASRRGYQAPAVVVLDRAVERAFPDGTRLMLTHTISQVLSKDAIEHVGEVRVPGGAEVLALRTRKADGTLREAEEIAGKQTISAPNLSVGDFVESETLEVKEPRDAFAPGFIGERFYFRSFEAPLDLSEYVFIAPQDAKLELNLRAGAPTPSESRTDDGSRILTFVARAQPQVFPERSAVPATEWIPSVRVSSGVSQEGWSRFVAERLVRAQRGSPEIRRVADSIRRAAGAERSKLAQAIAAWVAGNIEPEGDFTEPATTTLARGRGNRAGLMIALARSLDLPADLVLARSHLAADAAAPIVPSELDEFREVLVRFPSAKGDRFVDPHLRRAPFGYVSQMLDGAPAVVAGRGEVVTVASLVKDARKVTLRGQLELDGSARISATEDVTGWPAIEWREMLDRAGKDRTKLRQGFEQHWLGHHFPGAQLDTLKVEAGADGGSTRVAYAFKVGRFADRQGNVLRLRPSFFRAQPGRRYGTEPQRKTTLSLGPDVALELDAEIVLPAGAEVLDVGQGGTVQAGGVRFAEERQTRGEKGATTLILRRTFHLPLMRVSPADYQRVAAQLRAVDPLEQGEIRITVAE